MKEEQLNLFKELLPGRILDDIIALEAVVDIVAERDEAWARHVEARVDYADETMCGDPKRVTAERNAAHDALLAMGVDPELLV